MSSLPIPTSSPDVEALLLSSIGTARVFNTATVGNIKPAQKAPYRCIVIRAVLQNRATPISRYCRLTVSAWAVRSDGTSDIKGSRDLAADYAAAVERLSGVGIILSAVIESGPYRVDDTTGGPLYAVANLLLEVAV